MPRKMIKSGWVQELPGEAGGSADLHCGFVRAQGKDAGHSGAGQGVCCCLEAERRDASVEQRPLGSGGVAGDSDRLCIPSASCHPGHVQTSLPEVSRGDEEGQPINSLTLLSGCAAFAVLAVSVSIKTTENQAGKHLKMGVVILGWRSSPRGESRQGH